LSKNTSNVVVQNATPEDNWISGDFRQSLERLRVCPLNLKTEVLNVYDKIFERN
jgi:hypothetical protein